MRYRPKSKRKKFIFFSGGFTVQCHGSQNNGEIDAVQMELPSEIRLIREGNDDSKRENVGQAVGNAISEFYIYWYKYDQDSYKDNYEDFSKYELITLLYKTSSYISYLILIFLCFILYQNVKRMFRYYLLTKLFSFKSLPCSLSDKMSFH